MPKRSGPLPDDIVFRGVDADGQTVCGVIGVRMFNEERRKAGLPVVDADPSYWLIIQTDGVSEPVAIGMCPTAEEACELATQMHGAVRMFSDPRDG